MLRQIAHKTLLASPVALAAALSMPALASADAAAAPIAISAASNAPCEVTFSMENRTNSKFYQVDFIVDGEDFRGSVAGIPVGRWSVSSQLADDTPVFGNPGVGYRSDLEPVHSEKMEDLMALGYPDKLTTENYVVTYRVAVGPATQHRLPDWQTIEVPGCVTPPEPDPEPDAGSLASLSTGSGSLLALFGWAPE